MKRIIYTVLLTFICIGSVFAEAGKIPEEELRSIYTKYAESTSVAERLKYVFKPEIQKPLMEKQYANSSLGYTPVRFGKCKYIGNNENIISLEEFVEGTNFFRQKVEVKVFRYFVKDKDAYKIDWQASTCYNSTSFKKFKTTEMSTPTKFRCYARLSSINPYKSDFYAFAIYDQSTSLQFEAYAPKEKKFSNDLFDLFEGDEAIPVILEMEYKPVNSRYTSSEVFISDFVQKGWVILN